MPTLGGRPGPSQRLVHKGFRSCVLVQMSNMTRTNRATGSRKGRPATKAVMERLLLHPATRWLIRATRLAKLRNSLRWRAEHARWMQHDSQLVLHNSSIMYPLGVQTPKDAAAANAELVLGTLDEAGIPYTEVRHQGIGRTTVAVPRGHRRQLLRALTEQHCHEAVYVATVATYTSRTTEDIPVVPTGVLAKRRQPLTRFSGKIDEVAVLRIWKFYVDLPSGYVLGSAYGCEIEFWEQSDDRSERWIAPRVNVAGSHFTSQDVALLPRKRLLTHPPRSVFDLRMIDEIDFPIDVVYTWVDSSDPAWRRKFAAYSGQELRQGFHQEARGEQRFRSRDELKYSLRSLSMYAPWIRHVYIVTDNQAPEFIDFQRDGISLVDHSEIARAPEALPIFNSSAITTWLHRIPGLSEHFIYMNDDVFLGRDVSPARFFTASGLAKVFPSQNRRPFGRPDPTDEPHINITRNIRTLLEQEFRRSISRSVKHTPHAQLVSVQRELEKRFPDAYDRTSRSRFRHHNDIAADQLFHYYAQITGRAVVAGIRYTYVNIGDELAQPELERLLTRRDREVFCLNDAPEDGESGMTDAVVRSFLDAYFPLPSRWEKPSLSLQSSGSDARRYPLSPPPTARGPERQSA